MSKSFGKELVQSAKEALDYAEGRPNDCIPHKHKLSRIEIRLTQEEKSAWENKAAASGINLSSLIRHAVEGTNPPRRKRIEVDPALVRQIAQIGNNLNQLARCANRDKSKVEALAVIARLIDIDREVAALRLQIEGKSHVD